MIGVAGLEEQLSIGHETRTLEAKGPGAPEGHLFAKVVRAALSMGNLRDGGLVVIGLDNTRLAEGEPGLTPADTAAWSDFDLVAQRMAPYTDPPLRFDIQPLTLSNGRVVAVMEVSEFTDVPHLCAKGFGSTGHDLLRRGALYVRSRRAPETSEVAGPHEMREVLILATEKALRDYVATAERASVRIVTEGPATAELYRVEREQAWQ